MVKLLAQKEQLALCLLLGVYTEKVQAHIPFPRGGGEGNVEALLDAGGGVMLLGLSLT